MKSKLTFVIVLLAFFSISLSCSNGGDKKSDKTEQTKEEGKYICPMKCEGEKTYDAPGQCPVCNMDLEKVEEKGE